ncbi:MAG: cysteine desulfurase [Chloroflexi bacterium]|nr:cysteine desulfurase [Chloroflexota bacterium]
MSNHPPSIFLDYAATTPTDPQVIDAMAPYWSAVFGNSDSIHVYGQAAANALEGARETIAGILRCRPVEIVFTGSGTESDNLALRGAAMAARQADRGNHIVTTQIEHRAVGQTVEQLHELFGFETTYVPVDAQGLVDPDDVASAIRADTCLVSVMMANNEVGTTQPVDVIGRICRERNVVFHTDAVQAGGQLPLAMDELDVDLLSLSAHKLYGPKGTGLLFIRRNTPFVSCVTGGGQERGRRAGTVNVAGAVGLAAALELGEQRRETECERVRELRDLLIEGVLNSVPNAQLTGHREYRLSNNASFVFRDVEGESIVVQLDLAGIAVSSGSACTEGEPEPSFVLKAMGIAPEWSIGSLRVSFGQSSTLAEVQRVLEVLPGCVTKLRSFD